MGMSYWTIWPLAGSILPILPLLKSPYQTMPRESTPSRRIVHGCEGTTELALPHARPRLLAEREVERCLGAGGERDCLCVGAESRLPDRHLILAGEEIRRAVAPGARVHHEENLLVHVHDVDLGGLELLRSLHRAGQ